MNMEAIEEMNKNKLDNTEIDTLCTRVVDNTQESALRP